MTNDRSVVSAEFADPQCPFIGPSPFHGELADSSSSVTNE